MSWEDDYVVGQNKTDDQITPVVELPVVDDEIAIESSAPNPEWMNQHIVRSEQVEADQPWYGGLGGLAKRVGWEAGGAAAGFNLGQQFQKSIPRIPPVAGPASGVANAALQAARVATPYITAGIGGLTGKRFDQNVMGNVLPGDEEVSSDALALLGGGLATTAPTAAARVLRAPVTKTVKKNIADLNRLGMDYTPGIVSDSSIVQGLEQLLKEVPITSGNVNDKLTKIYKQFNNAIKHLSDDSTLDITTDAWEVGKKIQASAAAKVAKYEERSEALYRITNDLIPQSTIVRLDDTKEFLANYAGRYTEEYADLRKVFGDNLMDKIDTTLAKHEDIPWHILDEMRKQVGRKTTGMVTDAGDPGIARQLYRHIMTDMGAAVDDIAKRTNDSSPRQAWRNASRYWRMAFGDDGAMVRTFDDVAKAEPDKLFRALESGNISKIVRAKKATDPETWKLVRGAVVQRLGQATAAQQDYVGQVFSPRTFLTNYNKLRKASKRPMELLFGSNAKLGGIDSQLASLSRIADRLSAGGKFANPSGTAKGLAMAGAYGGMWIDPVTTAMTVGGAYGGSKLWTNKRFLDWMLAGQNVGAGTRAAGNWIASIPAFTGTQYISGSDENFMSNLKDGLNRWMEIPTVPNQ